MASSVLKPEDGPWLANKEECAVEALLGAIEDGESGTDPGDRRRRDEEMVRPERFELPT
jgi:hypothetical protein